LARVWPEQKVSTQTRGRKTFKLKSKPDFSFATLRHGVFALNPFFKYAV
jgi:hypothetical protein